MFKFVHSLILTGIVSLGATAAVPQSVEIPSNYNAHTAYFGDFLDFRTTAYIFAEEFFRKS